LSDFGSVKAPIVRAIEPLLPPAVRFLGLHPMCGTAGQGIDSARADLFAGAVLIATPTERTDPSTAADLASIGDLLQMRVLRMSPEEHDRQVAIVSHLPYLISVGLTRLATGIECAGPSFRDATRVAMSPAGLWEQILSLNRANVLEAVEKIRGELLRLGGLKSEQLQRALEQARAARSGFERDLAGQPSAADASAEDKAKDAR
jgi:prephenate dehydrogenase